MKFIEQGNNQNRLLFCGHILTIVRGPFQYGSCKTATDNECDDIEVILSTL